VKPNVQRVRLFSQALGERLPLHVTTAALRCMPRRARAGARPPACSLPLPRRIITHPLPQREPGGAPPTHTRHTPRPATRTPPPFS
jgi:hypothetical protein